MVWRRPASAETASKRRPQEEVKGALPEDANESNTEIVDEAYGMTNYLELWDKVEARA
jgi:hypothetical protein